MFIFLMSGNLVWLCWSADAVRMEWRCIVFLCCVECVEGTLVFYNRKFRNSLARLLWCVLRFFGFSCVCWGGSASGVEYYGLQTLYEEGT